MPFPEVVNDFRSTVLMDSDAGSEGFLRPESPPHPPFGHLLPMHGEKDSGKLHRRNNLRSVLSTSIR